MNTTAKERYLKNYFENCLLAKNNTIKREVINGNSFIDMHENNFEYRTVIVEDEEETVLAPKGTETGSKNFYFIKPYEKYPSSAEMLFSRLFKSAGINSPIYYPVVDLTKKDSREDYYGKMVISKNIETNPNAYSAYDVYDILDMTVKEDNKVSHPISGIFNSKNNFDHYKQYFTPKGFENFVKMYGLDIAIINNDRHEWNYFFDFSKEKINDVIPFDYGASGLNYYPFYNDISSRKLNEYFFTPFNQFPISRCDAIRELRENEMANSIISHKELGEIIGSTNLQEIANQLEVEEGYKVSQGFVDYFNKSIDNAAEDLVK